MDGTLTGNTVFSGQLARGAAAGWRPGFAHGRTKPGPGLHSASKGCPTVLAVPAWRTAISSPDPVQLQTYLAECALGNQRSFEALYRAVSSHLYAVALKSLRRADWAEEVLQEAFVRIWHHAGRYDINLSAPMTWMINITRNLAIDQLRKRKEGSLPDGNDDVVDQLPDDAAGPFDQLSARQDRAALTQCIDQLEGGEREAIVTAYFQGISYAELAQQMRAPLGSVKSWIRRGMERLRRCLES